MVHECYRNTYTMTRHYYHREKPDMMFERWSGKTEKE